MKIFILEPSFMNDGDIIAEHLIKLNNNLSIAKKHTSNNNIIDHNLYEYMDINDINLSFKNNSLLYITYNDNEIVCMTTDNYINNDIISIKYKEFNNIIPMYYNDVLIIIIDGKHIYDNKRKQNQDIYNIKYIEQTIEKYKLPYLYFMDDNIEDIANIINNYISSDEIVRKELSKEYS